MEKAEFDAIESALKQIVEEIAPDAGYFSKYGGEVIVPDPDDDKHFVGGIFSYKEHVSLEFSEGASFNDPDGQLEGKGKNRRHLKFQALKDVEAKDARNFLKQAFAI
ncbi:DUF1801 domain-containing protein [Pararhizobium sp. IMCC21322]|uniref:DUF1801 domain-containing protein n=1 Tax=Pararhizobium sp. IMCC21322 TaxID=3067903 RepID=UPI0027417047|nr:DUF1801 domain-containing protein [Pararhizobium sp. IMCC21322]